MFGNLIGNKGVRPPGCVGVVVVGVCGCGVGGIPTKRTNLNILEIRPHLDHTDFE